MSKRASYSDKSYVGMTQCFICGGDKDILLDRHLKERFPHHPICIDKEPCEKCKEYMRIGIIIISVRDGESGENPYRTGGFWVVKEETIHKLITDNDELVNSILKSRVMYMDDSTVKAVGLPMENKGE